MAVHCRLSAKRENKRTNQYFHFELKALSDLPLFICNTFAIFFIVESIFDSVFSSSFPKSSSILFRESEKFEKLITKEIG